MNLIGIKTAQLAHRQQCKFIFAPHAFTLHNMKKYLSLFALVSAFLFATSSYAASSITHKYPACVTKEYLNAITDGSSLESLMRAGKCTILKVGTPIVMLDRGFMTVKILYNNVELYAPSEAVR